jgi:hypothetical protein
MSACDWGDLDNVPAGFADGVDNDTQLTPGLGLSETGGVIEADFEGSGGDLGDWDTVARSNHLHDATYWRLQGNAGTVAGTDFLGTTDSQPLELHVNGARALRLVPETNGPSILGGHPENYIEPGAYASVISGGGPSDPGDAANTNNRVYDTYATIGGGGNNRAGSDDGATQDPTNASFATVAGGQDNVASAVHATVGGGQTNIASGQWSTIGGGVMNIATGDWSTVGGGCPNTASGVWSTVGGGQSNEASGECATVAGGFMNEAGWDYATVAGGWFNTATGDRSTVGGGETNVASGQLATVGGGSMNEAGWDYATVGGGFDNTAGAAFSTVAGGDVNAANGLSATVPGGSLNSAAGDYSFAAGQQAKANHDGAFVWADTNGGTPSDFASTDMDQFLIRASGGVGIGTNAPASALDVVGTVTATGLAIPTGANPSYVLTSDASGNATWAAAVGGPAWGLLGNAGTTAGTTAGTDFLGTTDDVALELHVNGARALRLVPETNGPSILGGHSENYIEPGADSATVSGGGATGEPNRVYDSFGTVSGGRWNQAGDSAGGTGAQMYATVGGGYGNYAENTGATVAGGITNFASGNYAAVPGGHENTAAGDYSLAAGHRAKANHWGSFVWADSQAADFASQAADTFSIRAQGGVGINTVAAPASALDVAGTVTATGLTIPTGANPSYVLTSDATGNASWQAPVVVSPAWELTGNAGTTAGTDFVGTTDNVALELHVNGARAFRLEPDATCPNVIGGHPLNSVTAGASGVTIAGGGSATGRNAATDRYCTVGGGWDNRVGDADAGNDPTTAGWATVCGGRSNDATGTCSFVGGGALECGRWTLLGRCGRR